MTAYYNEIDPFCIRWLRRLMRAGACQVKATQTFADQVRTNFE